METTLRTSYIYQRLDILYKSLTSVLPELTSPVSSCYMLKAMLAEVSYIHYEINDIKGRWRKLLPFDEDDCPEEEWEKWSENLNPKNIKEIIKKRKSYDFAYVDMNDDDEGTLGRQAHLYEELYHKLEKLSVGLRQIHFIVRAALPESILTLYASLKERSERERFCWQDDWSVMSPYTLEEHKKHLYPLVIGNFIKTGNLPLTSAGPMVSAQQLWDEMTDEHGIPVPIKVGRYMYANRFYLNATDLNYYFEYVSILECLNRSRQEEMEKKSEEKNACEEKQNSPCESIHAAVRITEMFNQYVDIEMIKEVVQDEFIPLLKPKNRWVCVWRILKDKNLFAKKTTMDQFIVLMSFWFPDDFKESDIHVYRYTILANNNRKRWSWKKYIDDIRTHKKASPHVYEKFVQLYNTLEDILKGKDFGEK